MSLKKNKGSDVHYCHIRDLFCLGWLPWQFLSPICGAANPPAKTNKTQLFSKHMLSKRATDDVTQHIIYTNGKKQAV